MSVMIETYCRDCQHEEEVEESKGVRIEKCPKCGSKDLFRSAFVRCKCGEKVYVNRFTNQCPKCGKLYNSFGEQLADPSEWDEEDRYACFGPQN